MRLQSLVAGLVCVAAMLLPGSAVAQVPDDPTFANDIAPIFYEPMRQLPSAEPDRADVVDHLQRGPTVGPVDSEQGRDPGDAAVASGPYARHPELQERPLAERRPDRDHRQVGGQWRTAGQPG